jgi:hypothetical protein
VNPTAPLTYVRGTSSKVDVWLTTVALAPKQRSQPADGTGLPATLAEAQELLSQLELEPGASWDAWVAHAPLRTTTIRVARPAGLLDPLNPTIDWVPFSAEIQNLIGNYRQYGTAANDVVAVLTPFDFTGLPTAECDRRWIDTIGMGLHVQRDIADWSCGLPFRNATGHHFSVVSGTAWQKTGKIDVHFRMALSQSVRLPNTPPTDAEVKLVCSSLFRPYSETAARADALAFQGIAPVAAPIADDLTILQQLGASGMPAPSELPKSMEVFRQCVLQAAGAERWNEARLAALVDLIAVLEELIETGSPRPGVARALPALEAVRSEAARGGALVDASPRVEFLLSHPLIAEPAVGAAVVALATALGTAAVWSKPSMLVLRKPPADQPAPEIASFDGIVDQLAGSSDDRCKAKAEVRRLAAEQLFGPGRALKLSIYRGFAEPLVDPVNRKTSDG